MTLLCLNIGNSKVVGGIFESTDRDSVKSRILYTTPIKYTSNQWGLSLESLLKEKNINLRNIKQIAISSVVPSVNNKITIACKKYFGLKPFFITSKITMDLKIRIPKPEILGTDLIAIGLAAINRYPKKPLLIADFGTTTSLSIINEHSEFLGASFWPGFRTAMNALSQNAAQLYPVEIIKPSDFFGQDTVEAIQTGLYFSQLGSVSLLAQHITQSVFNRKTPIILATGGYAHLFKEEKLFTEINEDLILHGLRIAFKKNQ